MDGKITKNTTIKARLGWLKRQDFGALISDFALWILKIYVAVLALKIALKLLGWLFVGGLKQAFDGGGWFLGVNVVIMLVGYFTVLGWSWRGLVFFAKTVKKRLQ